MAQIFFGHLLELGSPVDQAAAMTGAYIKAMLLLPGQKDKEADNARD